MALLTRKGFESLMARIMETGGLSEDMEKVLERLKDDFDEREGILLKYGESYDGESDEYEFSGKVSEDSSEWENKYNDLKKRYIDRFFSKEKEDIVDDIEDNMVEEDEDNELTIDELLKVKEDEE